MQILQKPTVEDMADGTGTIFETVSSTQIFATNLKHSLSQNECPYLGFALNRKPGIILNAM